MKYCRYCGTQLPDSAKFCRNCGQQAPNVRIPTVPTAAEVPAPKQTPHNAEKEHAPEQHIIPEIPITVDDIIEEMRVPEQPAAEEQPLTVEEIIEEVRTPEQSQESDAPCNVHPAQKKKRLVWLWILLGAVVLAAIAVVLIFGVFGGSNARGETLEYLDGDWYGWWMVTDATGDFEDMTGYWWDCCANFDSNRDQTISVEIWDENCPRKAPLSSATLSLDRTGTAFVENGRFLDAQITTDSWNISPENGEYKNAIIFSGTHEDPSGSGTITYYFLLRPWGEKWDDIARKSADDVPYLYESWYLPLIEAGKRAPGIIG